MKYQNAIPTGILIGILVGPTTCLAHELPPVIWPIGPFPFVFGWNFPLLGCLLILIVLVVEVLVLSLWFKQFDLKGNLWRSALLYIIARAGELGLMLSFDPLGYIGGPSFFILLPLYLIGGLIVKLLLSKCLYKRKGINLSRILAAISTGTVAGYLSGLCWSLWIASHIG